MKKLILIALVIAPFIPFSQQKQERDCWEICVNNKKIVGGLGNEMKTATIDFLPNGRLQIKYQCPVERGWKRRFIIMDETRATLLDNNQMSDKDAVAFSLKTLKDATGNKKFYIYTVATPADITLATAVRVRPLLLCGIYWKRVD